MLTGGAAAAKANHNLPARLDPHLQRKATSEGHPRYPSDILSSAPLPGLLHTTPPARGVAGEGGKQQPSGTNREREREAEGRKPPSAAPLRRALLPLLQGEGREGGRERTGTQEFFFTQQTSAGWGSRGERGRKPAPLPRQPAPSLPARSLTYSPTLWLAATHRPP